MDDVLKFTSTYEMGIDGKELTLWNGEIKEPVKKSGPEYISVVVHITDRIYRLLLSARDVRFMMLPPSHASTPAGTVISHLEPGIFRDFPTLRGQQRGERRPETFAFLGSPIIAGGRGMAGLS